MKNLMVYFLIALICLPLLSKVGIYVQWKFQQDYLTKTMCFSRGKSENMCKASCQLTKRMTADEKHNTLPQPTKMKEIQESPYIIDDYNGQFFLNEMIYTKGLIVYSNQLIYSDYYQQVFIPPDLI